MTRETKLAYHLEMVLITKLPQGSRVNAATVARLVANATDEDKQRAYERALTKNPLLLEDER